MLRSRKRYFQRSLRKYSSFLRIAAFVVLFLVFLGLTLFVLFRTTIFSISEVRVEGAGRFVNATDLQNLAEESVLGKSSIFLNKSEVKSTLTKNFRGARDIVVSIHLPNTLMLKVVERDSLALLFNDRSGDYFIIDSEGFVLGVVDESKTNLPKIRYEGDIQVGEIISSDLVPVYLDLMTSLDQNEVHASSVSFYPRYVRLFIQDGIEVLIGNDKDKLEALKVVKDLVRQESLEEKNLSKIDLRYDKVSVQ